MLSLASQVPGLIPSQNQGSLNIPGCKNSLPGRKNSRWILTPWYIYNTVLVSGVANSCTWVANSCTRGCLGPRVLRWNSPKQKFPKLKISLSRQTAVPNIARRGNSLAVPISVEDEQIFCTKLSFPVQISLLQGLKKRFFVVPAPFAAHAVFVVWLSKTNFDQSDHSPQEFCTGIFSLYCKNGLTRRCLRSSFVVPGGCEQLFFTILFLQQIFWDFYFGEIFVTCQKFGHFLIELFQPGIFVTCQKFGHFLIELFPPGIFFFGRWHKMF